jgi:hypothetical protein
MWANRAIEAIRETRADIMSRAAEMAADWWTERLQRGDEQAFRAALLPLIDAELSKNGQCRLECDYDPHGPLLEAVHAAGVQCTGMMFSADGILPRKTSLLVTLATLEPKEGYGNWTDAIQVDELEKACPGCKNTRCDGTHVKCEVDRYMLDNPGAKLEPAAETDWPSFGRW